jgi:hypothetical protein
MLRALVIFFIAMGVLEVVAIAIGKTNLMGGLVVICLAVFFAGVLHGLGGLQKDIRVLLAYLRESTDRSREQGPQQ